MAATCNDNNKTTWKRFVKKSTPQKAEKCNKECNSIWLIASAPDRQPNPLLKYTTLKSTIPFEAGGHTNRRGKSFLQHASDPSWPILIK